MKKTTKTVTAENHDVSLKIRDKDTETVWVFLHGWGGSKSVWEQVCKQIPFTSVTVDLPGFGQSDDLSEPWSIADYRDTVVAIVQKLKVDNIVLVGHSFGGQIATAVAAKNPERISGLVLVDAAVVRSPEPKLLSWLGHWLSPLFQLPGLRRLKGPLYDCIGADQPPENENLRKTMHTILREDQIQKLSDISIPVHIIWGKEDTKTPPKHAEIIANNLPKATHTVLDGGHHVFIDSPDEFLDELSVFNQQFV